MTTSVDTYQRALRTHTYQDASPAKQAGNYSGSTVKEVLKLILKCLTLSITHWVEKFGNRDPKVQEFARNSRTIYYAILNREEQNSVEVRLEDGRTLELTQRVESSFSGPVHYVDISLDGVQGQPIVGPSFDNILTNLRKDYEYNAAIYDEALGVPRDPEPTLSDALNAQNFQQSYRGDPSVLERIKNRLFQRPVPMTANDLRDELASAYQEVTGYELNDDQCLVLAVNFDGGMTGHMLSPRAFQHFFDEVVAAANLPDHLDFSEHSQKFNPSVDVE